MYIYISTTLSNFISIYDRRAALSPPPFRIDSLSLHPISPFSSIGSDDLIIDLVYFIYSLTLLDLSIWQFFFWGGEEEGGGDIHFAYWLTADLSRFFSFFSISFLRTYTYMRGGERRERRGSGADKFEVELFIILNLYYYIILYYIYFFWFWLFGPKKGGSLFLFFSFFFLSYISF